MEKLKQEHRWFKLFPSKETGGRQTLLTKALVTFMKISIEFSSPHSDTIKEIFGTESIFHERKRKKVC
jgi:hypothetical protein